MIRFAVGVGMVIFALIFGAYRFFDLSSRYEDLSVALEDAYGKRDEGKDLVQRIREIKKIGMVVEDAQKFNIERLLDIGAPGMEWRFVGQPLIRGNNRALYRYTYRISGPTTYADSQALLERMNQLPGFVVYRYCFNCIQPARGTPENLKMVQIEGYLYGYDAATLY